MEEKTKRLDGIDEILKKRGIKFKNKKHCIGKNTLQG